MQKLEGKIHIKGSPEAIWEFLTDPEKLALCLPDVEKMDVKDKKHFTVTIRPQLAFISGSFTAEISLKNLKKPERASLKAIVEGIGGSAEVSSSFKCKKTSAKETELTWNSTIALHGVLSTLPGALIEGFANRMSEQFFVCIEKKL